MYIYTCVTHRNAIYFHLHPARRLTHPVCTHAHDAGEPRPWLAPDTVLAVWSSKTRPGRYICWQRHGRESGTTGDGKPGTRDGKPGTHDGASGTTGYGKHGTGDGKPGTRDGEPEPGTRDQGVPGTADGMARDGTSAGNEMDHT